MSVNNTTNGGVVTPPELTIQIDQQYLGDSLYQASLKHPFLGVKSEKGTGKTTAAKLIIESYGAEDGTLLVTPRKKLNAAMASDLGLYYYEDVKKEANRERKRMMARRMATTPQALAGILSQFPEIKYKYILFDESESTAEMLVSSVTEKKAETIASLRNAALKADSVMLMDAAYGSRSESLMSIIKGDASSGMLINTFLRWSNIHARILDGGRFTDRRDASNALQVKYASEGKRFAISSGSAEYCETRASVLEEQFPHLNIALFTAKSSKQIERVLSDPDLVSEFDIVIFSPAVSIGVSFNVEGHFSTVFGVYPNNKNTGTSDDAVQGLARIRHPSDNEWIIVLDDDKRVFDNWGEALTSDKIRNVFADRYMREGFATGKPVTIDESENLLLMLASVCAEYRFNNKNNYRSAFMAAIESSGVVVSTISVDEVPASIESEVLTEKAKEKRTEKLRAAKTQSQKIDEEGYQCLKAIQKFRPDEITQDQLDSMARHRFEKRFNIDCDKLTKDELEKFLDWDEADVISQCINREIALCSPEFVEEYMKVRVHGVDGSEAFKVDLIDDKLNFRMKQKLLSYAVPFFDGTEYSHSLLKKRYRNMVRYVEKNYEEIVVTEVLSIPRGWREKPALLMNKLLDMCGYSHFSRRSGSGSRTRVYVAQSNPVVAELCQSRRESGSDWVAGTKRLIGLHEEILKTEEGKTRLERLWQEAGRTDDMSAFMAEFKDDIQDIENGVYPDDIMLKVIRRQ